MITATATIASRIDRRRIDHRGDDVAFQLHDLFDEGRESLQNQIENTARFSSFDHV